MLKKLPWLALSLLALHACESEGRVFGTESVTEPTLFAPDVISTDANEYAITFSPDGREAYFTRTRRGQGERPRIMVSHVVAGAWTEPEPASFSTGWEESPFLTSDGERLIFSARKDVPGWGRVRGNNNLWVVERGPDGWSQPVPLAGEVNKPRVDEGRGAPARSESGAILLSDGTLLYSTQEAPERAQDIYVADQRDGRFVNVRPMLLNSSGDEAHPAMSPDGRFLVFHGFRDVYARSDDLFVSERSDYGWSEPRPLPEPINSPSDESYASFSRDGRFLFFSSSRGPGGISIYYVGVEALGLGDVGSAEGGA
jgi:Tol biopolymer transport system component